MHKMINPDEPFLPHRLNGGLKIANVVLWGTCVPLAFLAVALSLVYALVTLDGRVAGLETRVKDLEARKEVER